MSNVIAMTPAIDTQLTRYVVSLFFTTGAHEDHTVLASSAAAAIKRAQRNAYDSGSIGWVRKAKCRLQDE